MVLSLNCWDNGLKRFRRAPSLGTRRHPMKFMVMMIYIYMYECIVIVFSF